MMVSNKLTVTSSIDVAQWSDFVYKHPSGNIFQTPEMMEVYKRTKRYEPITLAVTDKNDDIQALLLAYIIREFDGFLGSFSSRSIIQGGPLFLDTQDGVAALNFLLKNYENSVKKKALYTEVRNVVDPNEIDIYKSILSHKYSFKDHLYVWVKIENSEKQILYNMTQERRRDVRKAKKEGVIVEEITRVGMIPIFYDMLAHTYSRAKIPLVDISQFESAFNLLFKKNIIKFYLAKYMGEYVGAINAFFYSPQKTIYAWYMGGPKIPRLSPNSLLVCHILKIGAQKGYRIFDFGGGGDPSVESPRRDFKSQFGAEIYNFGRFKKIHAPLKYWISDKGFKVYKRIKY